MATPQLLESIPISGPNGEHVRVRFYDDGSIRLRVSKRGPMVIAEAFLSKPQGDVIVKLEPKN